MVIFPHSKINLGLNVVNRRPDGYHNLQTLMIPIGWTDILEITPSKSSRTTLTVSGNRVDCPVEKNLVMKAYRAVESEVGELPAVDLHLRKIVPDGAGLGGGSADAAATVKGLDELFCLDLGNHKLHEICSSLGADCPFFLSGKPMLATGTGTDLKPVDLPVLIDLTIVVAKPQVSVTTAEAYGGINPTHREINLEELSRKDPESWRDLIFNTFETTIFPLHPEIAELKQHFYSSGAVYAAMSGSGSAVYGLFTDDNMAEQAAARLRACSVWYGKMA
ncbi:MAG: 4-(cytidine 5'-diphospho)-2-C-methyl-D-erythritol kinase [Bacteroides sp.]|nr:4-(cytidine 5'-diphospho)-2-C-methyl-D-erythritol kinase [Bacteroides sp.]